MGCYYWCWSCFLPSRHYPKAYDDDLRRYRSPLQEHGPSRFPDCCQGRNQVLVQGSWCQHPSWCRWSRSLVLVRQDARAHVRKGLQIDQQWLNVWIRPIKRAAGVASLRLCESPKHVTCHFLCPYDPFILVMYNSVMMEHAPRRCISRNLPCSYHSHQKPDSDCRMFVGQSKPRCMSSMYLLRIKW